MEFERAIYRVYEKCLEGLREDEPDSLSPRTCRLVEGLVLSTALTLLACLFFLHYQFVGSVGCLPALLSKFPNPLPRETSNFSESYLGRSEDFHRNLTALDLRSDQILQIFVKGNFISNPSNSGSLDEDEEVSLLRGLDLIKTSTNLFHDRSIRSSSIQQNDSYISSHRLARPSANRRNFDYEFGFNLGLLAIPEEMRSEHGFDLFNVTLAGTECFGGVVTMALIPLGGIDTVVKNFLQNTFKQEGAVISGTGDYYTWSMQDIRLASLSLLDRASFKLMVLAMSCFSFFFVSTVTALLVRILISSGVVLLFPVFYIIQRAGVSVISWRLVSLSYPWIGVPIEILRARNQSVMPFVMAHIMRIIVYYSLYEAAQFAFSSWFFGELRPGQRELWIFAVMMLLEYYSMIYVRARGSITLFPRFCFALYLILHFYIYCQPSGFHLLAMLVMFLLMVWVMMFCVRKYELEAFSRGHVSIDQPRVLHNSIPWPVWSIALAPDFTLFWPLDSESTSIYGTATDGPAASEEPMTSQPAQTQVQTTLERVDGSHQHHIGVFSSMSDADPELGSLSAQRRPISTSNPNYSSLPINSSHHNDSS